MPVTFPNTAQLIWSFASETEKLHPMSTTKEASRGRSTQNYEQKKLKLVSVLLVTDLTQNSCVNIALKPK